MGDCSTMATDHYYMIMAQKNQKELDETNATYTQEIPARNVRHYRMTKQAKIRHCNVMREKVVEIPERLKVDDTNDPLGGPDADAIISRLMAESVNNRRTNTWGFFTHETGCELVAATLTDVLVCSC